MIPTIPEAARLIRKGQLDPVELLERCLQNIDRYESKVNAWVLVDRPGALAQAKERAAELTRGQYRGPLHGIPLGIKDIFDVFNWPTAAGSKLWANSIARADSTVVNRLRQAGAVLMGKTITTQYASFDPPPTRNPWDLTRTPGGSSSGSAAAVACGMCLSAMGSQTGGSITRPASFCGVAGCKPTYGRVSVAGVVPLAHSMDHPGPIARSVADLALMLQAIAGFDPADPTCEPRPVPDYAAALDTATRPPRLGLLGGLFEELADDCVSKLMEDVGRRLHQSGATVERITPPAGFTEVLARHRIVMAVEAAAFHRDRLRHHPDDYLPNIRGLLEEGMACPADEYARTKEHQRQLTTKMKACFEEFDALLCSATRGAAPDAATTGDPAFNSPWSYTGLPTVSLPAGFDPNGMPLAIQLVGPAWGEAALFAAAAWCERVLGVASGMPKGIQ
jgi:aspartyl-tRNA(Asn)/glutamyl-tRNA(Gln) amidotransferase subunit A